MRYIDLFHCLHYFHSTKKSTKCLLCVRPYLRLKEKGSCGVEREYQVHWHRFLNLQKTGTWHVYSPLPSPRGQGTFSHSPWSHLTILSTELPAAATCTAWGRPVTCCLLSLIQGLALKLVVFSFSQH